MVCRCVCLGVSGCRVLGSQDLGIKGVGTWGFEVSGFDLLKNVVFL